MHEKRTKFRTIPKCGPALWKSVKKTTENVISKGTVVHTFNDLKILCRNRRTTSSVFLSPSISSLLLISVFDKRNETSESYSNPFRCINIFHKQNPHHTVLAINNCPHWTIFTVKTLTVIIPSLIFLLRAIITPIGLLMNFFGMLHTQDVQWGFSNFFSVFCNF